MKTTNKSTQAPESCLNCGHSSEWRLIEIPGKGKCKIGRCLYNAEVPPAFNICNIVQIFADETGAFTVGAFTSKTCKFWKPR